MEGLNVLEKKQWDKEVESLKEASEDFSDGIFIDWGEGQEAEFDDLDHFLECHEVIDITKDQYDFMKKNIVAEDGYGYWLLPYLVDQL